MQKQCVTCGKEFYVSPNYPDRKKHCSVNCRSDSQTRFWAKVEKTDSCWLWKASCNKNGGHGRFWYKGRWALAHRISYIFAYGSILNDLHVRHKCDNPRCVRPEHLELGTHLDNMRDMYRKNRRPTNNGEKNQNSKLTWEEVRQIRFLYSENRGTCKSLGAKFKVDPALVNRIVRGKIWKLENDPVLAA